MSFLVPSASHSAGDSGHVTDHNEMAADLAFLGAFLNGSALVPRAVALADAATVSVDASAGNHFTLTLTGSHILGNPSSPADGQRIIVVVNPGVYTLSYAPAYNWGAAGAPTLVASKDNYLGFIYKAAASEWRGVAFAGGY